MSTAQRWGKGTLVHNKLPVKREPKHAFVNRRKHHRLKISSLLLNRN